MNYSRSDHPITVLRVPIQAGMMISGDAFCADLDVSAAEYVALLQAERSLLVSIVLVSYEKS